MPARKLVAENCIEKPHNINFWLFLYSLQKIYLYQIMEPLSIVHVIDRLECGGAERILITLANMFDERNHKVTVITIVAPGSIRPQLNKNIKFLCLHRTWKWNPFTMHKLIKEISKYDITHVHLSFNYRYTYAALKLCLSRVCVFYQEHHGDRVNAPVSFVDKKMFHSSLFIAVSKNLKQWAVSKLKMNEDHVFLLPNIILRASNASKKKENSKFVRLVQVANFIPVKNIEFTLNLLQQLLIRDPGGYHITFIGHIYDTIYFNKIKSLIHQKNLAEHISLIHDCDNVQSHLHRYDFALQTSTSESGPLVLLEYMAQRLPFLASDTGEVAQQVKSRIDGIIMSTFNVEEWVAGLQHLITHQHEIKNKLEELFDEISSPGKYYKACLAIYKRGMEFCN